MKTLFKGRKAAMRVVASALFAVVGLSASAFAQDLSNLDSSKKVISVSAGPDQTVEATTGTMNLTATVTGYTSESPVLFFWVNTANNATEYTGETCINSAPATDKTFRLVALNFETGDWGEDFITIHTTDSTAPQIWLLGDATVWVTVCTPYFESGCGVFDNADGASVPVVCAGQVDTTTVGTYTLTYTATDLHNNSASVTRTVHVIYNWSGFQDPVDPQGKSVFKLGSTIPLKFALTGSCANKTDLVAKLYLAKMSNGIAGTELEAGSTAAADSGNVFRYNGGKYMYNLSTKGLSEGTWQLRVDLGDGAIHAYQISLKK